LVAGGELFAKTVVLDELARQSVDYISEKWEGGELAWLVIEWVLARDHLVGRLLTDKADLRAFEYAGAKSIKQTDLSIIYEVLEHEIVVKVVGYDEAKAGSAGRA
jgi:hypothetical protein